MKTVYQSEDGKVFESQAECERHELVALVMVLLREAYYEADYSAKRHAEIIVDAFQLTRREDFFAMRELEMAEAVAKNEAEVARIMKEAA